MNVIRFHSQEEMRAHLIQAAADAHNKMHVVQSAITFGDFWVRFVDVANKVIEYGMVATPEEVYAAEVEAGATKAEANQAVEQTQAALRNGYMYGIAFSPLNRDGEWGHTHKAHVWPIDESLFHQAAEANFQFDLLPMSGKINLNIAFLQMKNHVKGGA